MNKCHFGGRLCADPELRSVGDNKKVVKLNLAVNMRMKGGKKETVFIRCEAWDTGAELIDKHFKKGDAIIVHGELRQDNWTDKEGNKRSAFLLRVQEFEFPLTRNEDRAPAPAPAGRREAAPEYDEPLPAGVDSNGDDDIPF